MELNEYMEAVLDFTVDLDLSEDELDRVDFTIRAIIMQMGWTAQVRLVEQRMYK